MAVASVAVSNGAIELSSIAPVLLVVVAAEVCESPEAGVVTFFLPATKFTIVKHEPDYLF